MTSYHKGEYIVRNYTEDQAGKDIRNEDMVQATNGMYYMTERDRNMEGQEHTGNADVQQLLQVLPERTHRFMVFAM